MRANGFATLREYQVTGGSEATLRVDRPAFVEGTVKTAAGTALAGVVVEARRKDAWGDPASTVTAADGSFFLGDLGSRLTFLVVRASSFAPPPPRLVELMPGECLHADFVVQPGRVVRGLIRDTSTGAPIVGARAATSWTMRDQGVSGRDGSYELRGVDERAVLHVAADGWAGAMRAVPAGPGPATVDFDLERGVEVTGRVVDEDGNGVAAAFVAAAADEDVRAGSRQTHWRTAVVDADGRFRLTGLARLPTTMTQPAPWRWQLLARAPGHGARVLALCDPARGTASTDLGDVLLLPEGVFEGRLVDSAGNPVGGGRVELRGVAYGLEGLLPPGAPPRSPLFQFGRREAVTAADGIFRFGGVGAGNYRVQARRGSGAAVEGGPYVLVSGSVTTAPDLVLAPGLTISGRLRGACPPGSLRASGIAIHANGGSDVPRCAVGADGTFRLEGLAPGDYLLSATDAPAGYAVVPRRGVTAGSNGVELDIVPAVTIEGRVVAPARGAQSGVNVIFRPQGVRVVKSVSTNAEGRFRIEAAPGVAGTITASHPDDFLRAARVLDVVAGTRDVELELPDHPRFAPVVRPR
ncbi:MAG: hypothetical protein JNK78_14905 [Planctomycetes bacterium]|nr:hypothetical protein [Planctomycetota bacterium]